MKYIHNAVLDSDGMPVEVDILPENYDLWKSGCARHLELVGQAVKENREKLESEGRWPLVNDDT